MDSLDCVLARTTIGRPLRNRMVAPPSLVSRMVRKSMGLTATSTRSAEYSTWTSRSVRLPPAVALALSLSEE